MECFFLLISRITGQNMHFGSPTNPILPSHIPGGSSSGSAVAVASELVDFAIGMCSPFDFFPSHENLPFYEITLCSYPPH